jgi:hypothetical protein
VPAHKPFQEGIDYESGPCSQTGYPRRQTLDPKWYTVSQVAQLLGCGETKVRMLIISGDLRSLKRWTLEASAAGVVETMSDSERPKLGTRGTDGYSTSKR